MKANCPARVDRQHHAAIVEFTQYMPLILPASVHELIRKVRAASAVRVQQKLLTDLRHEVQRPRWFLHDNNHVLTTRVAPSAIDVTPDVWCVYLGPELTRLLQTH